MMHWYLTSGHIPETALISSVERRDSIRDEAYLCRPSFLVSSLLFMSHAPAAMDGRAVLFKVTSILSFINRYIDFQGTMCVATSRICRPASIMWQISFAISSTP